MPDKNTYDYIIIGSGFGGSVSALRLSEKGYRVLLIEKGKRYKSKEFPKTNFNLKKYLWFPWLGLTGIQKLTYFKHAFILSGVGYGGGSLVYANTLMEPPEEFFVNKQWKDYNDWKNILGPFYKKAAFMLGRTKLKDFHTEDFILNDVAKDMNKESSFDHVYVAVNFDKSKENQDPYFNGSGPPRNACTLCAGCMVGCRENAKNTLDKNYLYFAEKNGVEVKTSQKVFKVEYSEGNYEISVRTVNLMRRKTIKYYAKGVIFSGGVLGTLDLLLKQKNTYKTLTKISDQLGESLRTNSESLCTATCSEQKLNNGVAISSIFRPSDKTYVEIVKYPTKSNLMRFLLTMATRKTKNPNLRFVMLLKTIVIKPIKFLKMILNFNWAENTIIFLVMQSVDNSMKMILRKSLFGDFLSIQNKGKSKVPAYIEEGQDVMYEYAKKAKGIPQNAITEILFNTPSTAHILGGCPMGKSSETGVINEEFKVHNYPNMYILDGSIIQGNLGVNPSFTITALAEYAMSKIKEKPGNTIRPIEELVKKG